MDIFSVIKSQVHILDVIQQYAQIKKTGLYWKGYCPFHHEKTASFTVSPHREIFYCFGCSSGGDVITFITKAEQCTPIEAVKMLADRYNIEIPEESITQINGSLDEKDHYFKLCNLVADWCHDQLKKDRYAQEYLKKRSISAESVTHFTIGLFPGGLSSTQSLIQYAQKKQILAQDLINANIIGKTKQVLYSPFENRIIFPIKDHLGRFCGFGGRTFKENDTRAKYYNSKENTYFAKGSLLFGFDLAKQAIQKESTVFLVEGYTDCVAMYQYGYKNTVATLGTACTQEHLHLLSRYTEKIYLLYDGDHAGIQAILRLTGLCWQANLDLNVISLPPSDDPASYLNTHGSIKKLLGESQDIFDFFIKTLAHDFHTQSLKQKLLIIRKILAVIARLDDPLKQDLLMQEAAKAVGLSFESLKQELLRSKTTSLLPENSSITSSDDNNEEIDKLPKLEKRIFFAILHNMQLLNKENEDFILAYLPKTITAILLLLKNARLKCENPSFIMFFDQLDQTDQKIVSQILVSFDQPVDNDEFNDLITQLQKKYWKQIVKDIKLKLEQAKKLGDQAHVNSILQQFVKLKKQITKGLY